MHKLMVFVGVVVLLSLLVSTGVDATSGKDYVVVEGHGALYAKGAGFAEIHGDGSIVIQGHGIGAVWVKGAEILHAQGHGQRHPQRGGALFTGWKGEIKAAGRNVAIKIEGGMIAFTAQGTGRALLVGVGTYKIGKKSGHWTADGIVIEYRP